MSDSEHTHTEDPEHRAITVRLDQVHLLHMVENTEASLQHAYEHDGGDPPEETPLWPTLQRMRGWVRGDLTIGRLATELLVQRLEERGITSIRRLRDAAAVVVGEAQSLRLDAVPVAHRGYIELWEAGGPECSNYVGLLLLSSPPGVTEDADQSQQWRLFLPVD